MPTITSHFIRVSIAVSTVLFLIWSALFVRFCLTSDCNLQSSIFQVFLDGYKAIVGGFLVAVLAVAIPQLLPETKYRFERFRDSREAYSKAQTGIKYLPFKLCELSLQDSFALLQSVHQDLHIAQTYREELKEHLRLYDSTENSPENWGTKNYNTLKAIKTTLVERFSDWNNLSPNSRLVALKAEIKKIHSSHDNIMSSHNLPVAIVATDAPTRAKQSGYPEPFASRMDGRTKRPIGDLFGLSNFGVNLTRLAPGGASSLRHAHSKQDEFIYILEGHPILHTDEGQMLLVPGMCAGFKAGTGNAHRLVNNTTSDVAYLEVGDRTQGDEVTYPDDDIHAQFVNGVWIFTHKD